MIDAQRRMPLPLHIRTRIARSVQFSELDWVQVFNTADLWIDDTGAALLLGDSLDLNALSRLLSLSLLRVVVSDTVSESLS